MYKSNTRIVTCVYHSHRDSEMGGRSWPVEYYKWTLFNIFNFGLPVTIFCSGNEEIVAKIQNIINEGRDNINPDINVDILTHDLNTHPKYNDIVNNRTAVLKKINEDKVNNPHGFNWVRNEVICHSKLMFLKKVYEHYEDVDNAVWMDAGITHWGLNPRYFGGMEINGLAHTYTDFYPFNPENMFTPDIGAGYERIMKSHKLFFIGHNNNWYSTDFQRVNADYLYDNPELKQKVDPSAKWVKNCYNITLRVVDENTLPTVVIHHSEANTDPDIKGSPIQVFSKQIVGGIIGTSRESIDHLYEFYYKYLDYIFNHNHKSLFTEEPIMSLYYTIYMPKLFNFTDWNHNVPHEPPNPCTTEGTFPKSFYTVWGDFKNYNVTSTSSPS